MITEFSIKMKQIILTLFPDSALLEIQMTLIKIFKVYFIFLIDYSNIQMSSQNEENDDKLEHMFFKSNQNNSFKNNHLLSNTANK